MQTISKFQEAYVHLQLFNSSAKVTLVSNSNNIILLKQVFRPLEPYYLKQRLRVLVKGLSIYKNNFISHTSYKTMERLIETGIPQNSYKFFFKHLFDLNLPPPDKNPKVFAIDDLSFGFVVWLYACAISGCAFIAEVLYFYSRAFTNRGIREMFGLFALLTLLKERMRFHR